ncbi:TolB family protein [Prolixibacter denitrificans]|uniref:WD40 repeat protein n=1 Tax=Prolixibacter denitrificans TaxID=1541063 RepID=A0A2P8CCE9_9BACT|nr:PD40 domain-containing protein [Prolixibacter denitrificans]PSK82635.1 WD40 repeat protein [Prolixibacter denitrificans]GET21541.1 hypothetical protein JCM18694_17870 [Prolixibacter denitrificans]
MKKMLLLLVLLTGISITGHTQDSSQEIVPFMPELMNRFPNVRDVAISPDGSEIYFSVSSFRKEFYAIVVIKRNGDEWSEPVVAPFSGQYNDLEPAISPDGLKLFFASQRPLNDTINEPKDWDIWYVERKSADAEWSAPINPGAPLNSDGNEFYPSVTNKGDVYFTTTPNENTDKEDIFVSRYSKKGFSQPVALPAEVNTDGYEFNAFIAPDESYLIFSSFGRKDGNGGGDLYIAFRGSDGKWQTAQNMGPEINSEQLDYCPFVDVPTQTLYFTSESSNVRKYFDRPQTLEALEDEFYQFENGLSRIYQMPFSPEDYQTKTE